MERGMIQKLLTVCLTLLLMMSAIPMQAEAPEPEFSQETEPFVVEMDGGLTETVESLEETPTEENNVGQETTDAEDRQEQSIEQTPQEDEQPEESAADREDENNAGLESDAEIAQFFGVNSIEGYEEFYRALYDYAMQRAGNMPVTVQLASRPVTFSGAKQQITLTEGTISSPVPLPGHYVVTFEAIAEGRLPGTYTPVLVSANVWDSLNNIDMTRFFDVGLEGGAEITSEGSLLMISADDVEVEYTAFNQHVEVTTGLAFINWVPMSDELRLTLRAYEGGRFIEDNIEMWLDYYAIEVIEDGMDITEYFEYVFASAGKLSIVPPSEKIPIVIQAADTMFEYTGEAFPYSWRAEILSINGITDVSHGLSAWVTPPEELIDPGSYTITGDDWIKIVIKEAEATRMSVIESILPMEYHELIILPSTMIIYEPSIVTIRVDNVQRPFNGNYQHVQATDWTVVSVDAKWPLSGDVSVTLRYPPSAYGMYPGLYPFSTYNIRAIDNETGLDVSAYCMVTTEGYLEITEN